MDKTLDNRYETEYSIGVDVNALESDLKAHIDGVVSFDQGTQALYATDGSNYRQKPMGVVFPKSEKDIVKITAISRKYNAPLLSRGCGTSLAGQCCNVAVVMDMTRYYNEVLEIDKDNKHVKIQPGIVLDTMREKTSEEAGLTFGPDPATHSHCAVGGMLGNNSCGVHSVMSEHYGYGARMSDNTHSMTVLTYDGCKMEVGSTNEDELEKIIIAGGRKGEIYEKLRDLRDKYAELIREKFPDIPRRVSGYDLPALLPKNGFNVAQALVGSEGTCVTILDATMKLMPEPKERSLLVLGYPTVYEAGSHVVEIMNHKPIGLEGFDHKLIEFMKRKGLDTNDISLLPSDNSKGWLLVEFGGDSKNEAEKKAKGLMNELKDADNPPEMSLFDDSDQEQKIWKVRESGLGATAFVPGEPFGAPGWEDSAVPPEKVGDYLKDLRQLFDKYDYHPSLYGHFGQGCIHCRVGFDVFSEKGLQDYKNFTIEASHLVVDYGGTLSGEHGDGQARADLLEIMFGEELVEAFREFKSIWDPDWKMNPGKIVDAYGQLSNLRLGTDYAPPTVDTHFHFLNDNNRGSFGNAALRCVGVGNCRQEAGGTMCPSYMVTREEKNSTRGRAHLLFEMLQGDIIDDVWKSDEVKEALDLCLACKGCKSECPVNVDMATYKAEFLSHYYEGKLRPRSAYAFGLVYWWARMASKIPGIANFFSHASGFSSILKKMGGVAPERTLPKFADKTFVQWFKENRLQTENDKPDVILWPDTFNNFFKPDTLKAGVAVLERAGYNVKLPGRTLCCGRPLYDFGFLKKAKKMLYQIIEFMRDDIRAGIPVVGLEPSCVAVFRDEMKDLLANNQDAKRLSEQTFTLGEFISEKAEAFNVPELHRKAVVHGHCHHKSIMGLDDEKKLFDKMNLDYEVLTSGCCGMAGYFGYEKGRHYDVSVKAGERVLLPAVRNADDDTLIISNGFSCREQIEQLTNRKGLHIAEVLQLAFKEKPIEESQMAAG